MPTTRIEIEQLGHAGWVGEVEVAGLTAKRIHVTATSFGAIMNRVMDAYLGERPEEAPPPATPEPAPPQIAFADTLAPVPVPTAKPVPPAATLAPMSSPAPMVPGARKV